MRIGNISEEERDIIRDNWSTIKTEVENSGEYKNTINNLEIHATNDIASVQVILKKDINISININKKAKVINFKYKKDDDYKERKELIYNPMDIKFFTKYFQMEHPVYSKNKGKETLNISVDDDKSNEIFEDPDIKEIFDDRFNIYINIDKFKDFFNKERIKVSDYYDSFSKNKYSKIISEDKFLSNEKRLELFYDLTDHSENLGKIKFLIGSQKIGMTLTVKKYLRESQMLYINFEDLYEIKKTSDKRKYIYYMLINLFNNFEEYKNFINKYIFEIKGYNDILIVIKEIVSKIKDNLKEKDFNIVLDNYDDYYVGKTKISNKYIEELFDIIQESKIKLIFLGRGLFISNLLIKHLLSPNKIEKYIFVKYFDSLYLDIENEIHNYNKKNKINEIENYFKERFNNNEKIMYNMLLIKNINYIINELDNTNIPFQFFNFQNKDNELKIKFQFNDLFDINNRKLREYIAKSNSFNFFNTIKSHVLKGIILEDLIISLLMNNKTFKNLKFPEDNIIEIDNIYKYACQSTTTKIDKLYKEGPILIIQKDEGEVFDFGIVFENQNINYFIGGQIGINKKSEEINNYISKLEFNKENILANITNLTNRKINEIKFLIILSKEMQSELKKEFDKIYKELKSAKSEINYEKKGKEYKANKLNHINSTFGIYCCEKAKITYFLFSTEDFYFYDDKILKIEYFDVDKINSLMGGFQYFCKNEYNLVTIYSDDEVLTSEEKVLFKQSIIDKIPYFKEDIEDIIIKYEINDKIPLLVGTPWNYAILSLTNDIKVLTYFNKSYIHFVLEKKNFKVLIYNQDDENLFDFEYNHNSIKNRYFVKFVLKEEMNKTTRGKKEKGKKLKNEKKDEENYYKNNLKFLQRKRFDKD